MRNEGPRIGMKLRIKTTMFLFVYCVTFTKTFGAGDAVAKGMRFQEYFDEDTFIPLCTNAFSHASCHYENIRNTLKWQLNAIKDGLANYANGDAYKLKKVASYLAAYARKLERSGQGYAAATNAYCAISLLKKSASRGCDEARAACYCCLGFGGSIGRHGVGLWSGPPSCYSFHMHDVPMPALRGFEPPPDYFVGEFHGRRRYVRVYDRNMKLAEEYKDKAERRLMSWHTVSMQDCVGWREQSELVEIVHVDFASLDVRAHVEKLIKEMEADIAEADAQMCKARAKEIEERRRRDEEELQRRLRMYEQEIRENEEHKRRKKGLK